MRGNQLFDWVFQSGKIQATRCAVVVDSEIDNKITCGLTFNFIGQRISCQRSIILDRMALTRILLTTF